MIPIEEIEAVLEAIRANQESAYESQIKLIDKQLQSTLDKHAPVPQFYKGQTVLMRDDDVKWFKEILLDIDSSDEYRYITTGCEYRYITTGCDYMYCKPDPDALFQWLPNPGHRPDTDKLVVILFDNGDVREDSGFEWDNDQGIKITHYAVINKPEFINNK